LLITTIKCAFFVLAVAAYVHACIVLLCLTEGIKAVATKRTTIKKKTDMYPLTPTVKVVKNEDVDVKEPTESVTEPTESVTEPTESVTEPTESVTEPTESVTEPTESVKSEPTESVKSEYVGNQPFSFAVGIADKAYADAIAAGADYARDQNTAISTGRVFSLSVYDFIISIMPLHDLNQLKMSAQPGETITLPDNVIQYLESKGIPQPHFLSPNPFLEVFRYFYNRGMRKFGKFSNPSTIQGNIPIQPGGSKTPAGENMMISRLAFMVMAAVDTGNRGLILNQTYAEAKNTHLKYQQDHATIGAKRKTRMTASDRQKLLDAERRKDEAAQRKRDEDSVMAADDTLADLDDVPTDPPPDTSDTTDVPTDPPPDTSDTTDNTDTTDSTDTSDTTDTTDSTDTSDTTDTTDSTKPATDKQTQYTSIQPIDVNIPDHVYDSIPDGGMFTFSKIGNDQIRLVLVVG
jgi:hypothetical protein